MRNVFLRLCTTSHSGYSPSPSRSLHHLVPCISGCGLFECSPYILLWVQTRQYQLHLRINSRQYQLIMSIRVRRLIKRIILDQLINHLQLSFSSLLLFRGYHLSWPWLIMSEDILLTNTCRVRLKSAQLLGIKLVRQLLLDWDVVDQLVWELLSCWGVVFVKHTLMWWDVGHSFATACVQVLWVDLDQMSPTLNQHISAMIVSHSDRALYQSWCAELRP